jgi:hypothetical protein
MELTPARQAALHAECSARHASRAFVALWCGYAAFRAGVVVAAIVAIGLLSGCHALPSVAIPRGALAPEVKASAPADTGKPAVVNSSGEESRIDLPAGSVVTVTRTEAQPATDKTPARPAFEVREIKLASDSAWYEKAQHIAANTGTVDTSVAMRRIDMAERRWLLWAAIGCGVAGLLSFQLVPAWPGLGRGLLAGAAFAFAAWKLADVPAWAWCAVVGAGALIALGYKRAELDANNNGVPDILEKKATT